MITKRDVTRRIWLITTAMLLAIGIVGVWFLWKLTGASSFAHTECKDETLQSLSSPNGSKVASIIEEICSSGPAFTTVVLDKVRLSIDKNPDKTSDVLILEGGDEPGRPHIRWIDETMMEVKVPNKSLIGLQKQRYESTDVRIIFDPDDPAERARWLKSLNIAQ